MKVFPPNFQLNAPDFYKINYYTPKYALKHAPKHTHR